MTIMRKAMFLAYLYSASIGSAQSVASKSSSERPFSIEISPVERDVKLGSEVYVKVRVTNTSTHDTVARGGFYAQGLNMSFGYDCRNAGGESVNKEVFPVGSIHGASPLGPGGSSEETAPISRACDLSRPGRYDIQVSRQIPNDPKNRIIRSNTIEITIQP
jgi:hypothetical protein